MATINIVITDAGLAEIVNAEQTGTAPVVLTEVGLGTGQYKASPSQTALTGEFKRVQAVAGGAIGDNALHLSVHDDSDSAYTVFELGVYTASGTLFAVYSQPVPIIQKAAPAHMLLALDMVLTNVDPDSVTVGDTNFQLNSATTTRQGIVELATGEEVQAGVDSTRVVTPAALKTLTATTGRTGLVELATATEAIAGTDGVRAITPSTMVAAFVRAHMETGYQKLPGGMLLQWGRAVIAQDGSTRIAFPLAFPTACVFGEAISMTSVMPTYGIATMDKAAIYFRHSGNGSIDSAWFAIGY